MSSKSSSPASSGSQALSRSNKDQNVIATFKTPSTTMKKTKPKILTEERYIEEMTKIIQRDFFPDLDKLRAQNEYLDAMERKDYTQMEKLRAKYSGHRPADRSGSVTPATFETPATIANGNTPAPSVSDGSFTPASTTSTKQKKSTKCKADDSAENAIFISEKHSLDGFLQKYTSEDNQSFQEIMERADERLRIKYQVLYRNEELSAEQLARALELPSIEDQFQTAHEQRSIETWTYKNRNSVMYPPDGVEYTIQEQIDAASKRQSIQYNATRLDANPFNEMSRPSTESSAIKQSLLHNKIGLDGNTLASKMQENADEGAQVRGFNMVMTPSPRPGEALSPLMTWGEIEGTPFRLDGGDTPLVHKNAGSQQFKINENTRRENIGLALAERAGEKMRAQKQRAMDTARRNMSQRSTPFIRSNIERLATMSPAARRLATSKLGLGLGNSPFSGSTAIRATTTTPIRQNTTPRLVAKTPKRLVTMTNKKSSKIIINESSSLTSTLTDNLLQIPKRLSAADFF